MPNSMATPFSFLKGQEDEDIEQIHSLIKKFKQNAEALNAAIVAYVREENKCAYAKFVEELAWGIPMDLATLPEAKRQNILNWIKSNFDKKQISNTRNLGEVMQFARKMLEGFKPGDNLPETDFQHDNHPPPDDSDPGVEGRDSKETPLHPLNSKPPQLEDSTIGQLMDPFFDAATEFQNKEQPPTPDPNPPPRTESLEAEKENIEGKKKGAPAPSANNILCKDEPVEKSVIEDFVDANYWAKVSQTNAGSRLTDHGIDSSVQKRMETGYSGEGKRQVHPSLPFSKTTAPPKPNENSLNIMIIGETGAGKTTFVNGFPNYLQYFSLDEALVNDPIVTVRTVFSMTIEKDQPPIDISMELPYNPLDFSNEQIQNNGQSRTQNAQIYSFRINYRGIEHLVRLIDTPGVNDIRGQEQDLMNFYNTTKIVDELGEIHAICILLKPNETRITRDFKKNLDTLLGKLPKSAAKSVLFCFTHTEPFEFRPGQSLVSLEEYLTDLKTKTKVDIKATEKNIFCIDNNCFRFQCTVKDHKGYMTKKAAFEGSWKNNRDQMLRMLDYAQTLNPQFTSELADIARMDRCFQDLVDKLVSISKEHASNIVALNKNIAKSHFFPEKEKKEVERRKSSMCYILLGCSYFTEFLQRQSISIPDHFAIRLQQLITAEEKTSEYTKSSHNLPTELKAIASEYIKKLEVLTQQSSSNEFGSATPLDIERVLEKMRALKYYGERIPQVDIFPKNRNSSIQTKLRC